MKITFNPLTGQFDITGDSSSGGGAAIGSPVTGSTPGSVLFIDSSGNLAEDNVHLFWDATNHTLTVGDGTNNTSFVVNGFMTANLVTSAYGFLPGGSGSYYNPDSGFLVDPDLNYHYSNAANSIMYDHGNNQLNYPDNYTALANQNGLYAINGNGIVDGTNQYHPFTNTIIFSSNNNDFTPPGSVGLGTTAPNALLDINSDTFILEVAKTPASASAAGTTGMYAWDSSYLYICTATNTWRRVAHATW